MRASRARRTTLLRRVLGERRGRVGASIVGAIVVMAVLAPWIAPFDPNEQAFTPLQSPSWAHLVGTDDLGRDLLSRIIYGARVSLAVSLLGVGIGVIAGVLLGLIAAQRSGILGSAIMRGSEIIQAFPGIILAIAVVAVLGPGSTQVSIAIGINSIPFFVRLTHGSILKEMQLDYVASTVSLGAKPRRVALQHLLPNGLPSVLPLISVRLGTGVRAEAALSFLGFGATRPTATWGGLLNAATPYIAYRPWQVIVPGMAIVLLVVGFTLIGDAVQRAIDPRSRPRRMILDEGGVRPDGAVGGAGD